MAADGKPTTCDRAGPAVARPSGSLAGTVFLLAVAVFCLRQLTSFDLFWYLRTGEEWLKRGGLLWTDPFSYTSGQTWINHEWLAEISIALAYRAGGFAGLVCLQAAMVVTALALLLRRTCARDRRLTPACRHWRLVLSYGFVRSQGGPTAR